MTNPAKIEAVARRYCQLMGLDPDKITHETPGGWIDGGAANWVVQAPNVKRALAMSTAIREVMKDD